MKKSHRSVFVASLLLAAAGCAKKEPDGQQAPAAEEMAAPKIDEATAATITGKVNFEGAAPEMKKVEMPTEAVCHEKTQKEPVYTETVMVNDNKTLRNVFVYVKEGLQQKFPAPKEEVVFDQRSCWYHPHVVGIQVGQKFKILNSDVGVLHNIHAVSEKRNGFNFGMPGKEGMAVEREFRGPEIMVRVKCDVHSWMGAYVGVLDHPYYSVTGADGTFQLKTLPPGQYVIEAWHERYGTATENVTVGPKETKEILFTFKG